MSDNDRQVTRHGVAAYFGGTLSTQMDAYQNGPLLSLGLGTVRAGYPKLVNDADLVAQMPAGRGMGAFMVVEIGPSDNVRRAIGGAPVVTAGVITTGGKRFRTYQVNLQVFHLAEKQHAEDAQSDLDSLLTGIEYLIMSDPTLGGLCTQAGEGRFGIKTDPGHPTVKNGRTYTWSVVRFELLRQVMA